MRKKAVWIENVKKLGQSGKAGQPATLVKAPNWRWCVASSNSRHGGVSKMDGKTEICVCCGYTFWECSVKGACC